MSDNAAQREFFPVEIKEDTPEKIAEAQGVPTKYFYWAFEFNLIKKALNTLYTMIGASAESVLTLISDKVVDFDEIGDLSIVDLINSLEAPGIYLGIPNATYIKFKQNDLLRVYAFVGTSGYYGDINQDLLALSETDLLQLYYEQEGETAPTSNVEVFDATFYLVSGADPAPAGSPQIADFTPTFTRTASGDYLLTSNGLNPLPKMASVFYSITTHLYRVTHTYQTQNSIRITVIDNATNLPADPPGDLTRLSLRVTKSPN